MNEKPKSIWKKAIRVPQLLLAWLGLMLVTTFIFILTLMVTHASMTKFPADYRLLITGAAGGTILLAGWFLIRWLCRPRNLKRSLFCVVAGITLVALFYAEENWRGWNAWQQYRKEQIAQGEKPDFKDYIPAPVPEDQNFAMAPVVAGCYGQMLDKNGHEIMPRNTNVVNRLRMPRTLDYSGGPTNGLNWENAALADLKPWQNYYRGLALETNLFPVAAQPQTAAQDVVLALSKYDGTIEEFREAAARPFSRFPIEYDKDDPAAILLPHLGAMKQSSQLLQLRATAELQAGENEKAFADIQLNFRLIEAIRTEPFIITHLVRFAILQITLQPLYDGLAEHQWTDGQLVELDAQLAKLDCLADYAYSVSSEPAAHAKLIDYLEQKRGRCEEFLAMLKNDNDESQRKLTHTSLIVAALYLAPKGWFYQNELRLSQLNHKWNAPIVDVAQHVVRPKIARQGADMESAIPLSPYNFFARLILPTLGGYAQKAAFAQNSANLARTALALERYRLAHGSYPQGLEALAPQFIAAVPLDVIGGGSLKYRPTSDGQFVLYSMGWNETDDGGMVAYAEGGTHPKHDEGDWVWRYPAR